MEPWQAALMEERLCNSIATFHPNNNSESKHLSLSYWRRGYVVTTEVQLSIPIIVGPNIHPFIKNHAFSSPGNLLLRGYFSFIES